MIDLAVLLEKCLSMTICEPLLSSFHVFMYEGQLKFHLFHLSILVDQEDLERKAVGMVKSAKTVVEGVGILQRRVEAEGKAVEPSGFEDGFSLSQ